MATTYEGVATTISADIRGKITVDVTHSRNSGSTTYTIYMTSLNLLYYQNTNHRYLYTTSTPYIWLASGTASTGSAGGSATKTNAWTTFRTRSVDSNFWNTTATGSYDSDTTVNITLPALLSRMGLSTPSGDVPFISKTVSYTIPKLTVSVSLNKNTPPGVTASNITLPSWTTAHYKNDSISNPGTPTCAESDWVFIGWYTSASCTAATKVTFPFTLGTSNVTLYAGWAVKKGDHYYQVTDTSNRYVKVWCADSLGLYVTYDRIPSTISLGGNDYTVTSMDECYKTSPYLTGTVHVPPTVTSMTNCFQGTTKPIYVIPHSASSKTAWTTATSSLSNVHVMNEPAIDTYHNSTSNCDTITFGGYDEAQISNKIISYLDILGGTDVYISENDELAATIANLKWYDLVTNWEPEEYFYVEPVNTGTNMNVKFQEIMTSGANKSSFTNYTTPTFQYSYDKSTWNTYTVGNNLSINKKVYFRGDNLTQWYDTYTANSTTYSIYLNFTCDNQVKSGGNIMSLRYKNFNNITSLPCSYAFYKLFYNNTNLLTSPTLPATVLTTYCYSNMFYGCNSLKTAPALPAVTLTVGCYEYMFHGCSSLRQTPALLATTLAVSCYTRMFFGCTSLIRASKLPATTLYSYCYAYMFYNCTSLVTPPTISATTLATNCCYYMFYGCTSLTATPTLLATTLESNCYESMFSGCTSLIRVSELPATTLKNYCYKDMFGNCTALQIPPSLPATTLASGCYGDMFYNCTSLTRIPKLPATALKTQCYRHMFYASSITASSTSSSPCIYEYRIPFLDTGTTGTNSLVDMFTNYTPTINTTFYVSVPILS